jgi:protein-L-isoaspartate(D-aspartate) O-methyltransferase
VNNLNQLLDKMEVQGFLVNSRIRDAFVAVDRKDFVKESNKHLCYEDIPLSIGYGQTISQPSTVAFMLELLCPQVGQQVLDIGFGSGYTTALLARIVKDGRVFATERIEELYYFAAKNLENYQDLNFSLHLSRNDIGLPNQTFDRILVSAAADIFPSELLVQLKSPGRLVIPIKNSIHLFEKTQTGKIINQDFFGFSFVPLIFK